MTWMEATMQPSKRFADLKQEIAKEFGETASDDFLPHSSICYFPYKEGSFEYEDACKLVEHHPEVADPSATYEGIEILLVAVPETGPVAGWPYEIVHRVPLHDSNSLVAVQSAL